MCLPIFHDAKRNVCFDYKDIFEIQEFLPFGKAIYSLFAVKISMAPFTRKDIVIVAILLANHPKVFGLLALFLRQLWLQILKPWRKNCQI